MNKAKIGFWWLLFLFFSFGISERTIVFLEDNVFIATELIQYVVICLSLISLVFLYPKN